MHVYDHGRKGIKIECCKKTIKPVFGSQSDTEINGESERWTDGHMDRQTERQKDGQIYGQLEKKGGLSEGQRDRQNIEQWIIKTMQNPKMLITVNRFF